MTGSDSCLNLMWSSAVVAHPPQSLTCCVFWDAFLLTTGEQNASLSYNRLPVTSDQSLLWSFSVTRCFRPQALCMQNVFCFPHHSVSALETAVCEKPRTSDVPVTMDFLSPQPNLLWSFSATRHLFQTVAPLHAGCFFVFRTILYHLLRLLCAKSPGRQQALMLTDTLDPYLDDFRCRALQLPHDWPIVPKWTNTQVFLIKCTGKVVSDIRNNRVVSWVLYNPEGTQAQKSIYIFFFLHTAMVRGITCLGVLL